VNKLQEDAGTIFEQRRAVHTGACWVVAIYRVRARQRDGRQIWVRVADEPGMYCRIRWLLRLRPDVQRGGIHNAPVFDHR
jgi:hypothetical protein